MFVTARTRPWAADEIQRSRLIVRFPPAAAPLPLVLKLPDDPAKLPEALKGKALFLTCYVDGVLCVATTLATADAIGEAFAAAPGRKLGEAQAHVMKKTALR